MKKRYLFKTMFFTGLKDPFAGQEVPIRSQNSNGAERNCIVKGQDKITEASLLQNKQLWLNEPSAKLYVLAHTCFTFLEIIRLRTARSCSEPEHFRGRAETRVCHFYSSLLPPPPPSPPKMYLECMRAASSCPFPPYIWPPEASDLHILKMHFRPPSWLPRCQPDIIHTERYNGNNELGERGQLQALALKLRGLLASLQG